MKCLNVLFYQHKNAFPILSMIHLKTGKGIPSVLLFATKCIFIDRIQYHVSLFEHQFMLCILSESPFVLLRRYIMLIRSFSKVDLYYRCFIYQHRQCFEIAFVIVSGCKVQMHKRATPTKQLYS